ncbi:MAG: glycerate kinase [Phycisphaerales bacterium]|nr:glycerate kinase [Phycisphaerales bacterium]
MQTSSGRIRRILVATDSLKGTCTAIEAAAAIGDAIAARMPGVEVDRCPLGDGGEGTLDVLATGQALRLESHSVLGPRRDRPRIEARLGISSDGRLAVVELAEAAGLHLLVEADRDPRWTGTGGVGELLDLARARLESAGGARPTLMLTVGGSGTVDGGVGALSSMGVEFQSMHEPIRSPLVGDDLARIERIDLPAGVRSAWAGIDLRVATDVRNPLTGPMGAARIFGPQKGADESTVEFLEHGLESWVEAVGRCVGVDRATDAASSPGAGAAGGIAFALQALFGARLESGFDLVADRIGLEDRVRAADLVVTSEGRLDAQSMMGKATGRLLELAASHGTPVAAIPGSVGDLPRDVRARFRWIRSLVETCGPSIATSDPVAAMVEAVRLEFTDPAESAG